MVQLGTSGSIAYNTRVYTQKLHNTMNTEKSINETSGNTPDVKDSYKHSLLDVWAFAEWCAFTYVRHNDWWVHKHADKRNKDKWKATSELWALWWENYR